MATLKASQEGLVKIKQARSQKGWSVDDFRWMEAASLVLGTNWKDLEVLAVGISEGTWKRFLAGKHPINADAFKAYCQVLGLSWEEVAEKKPIAPICIPSSIYTDWGEAPDVSIFYGRQEEINTVKQWVIQENCRLITLLGMGGIGKTSLSVKLAQQIVETVNVWSPVSVIWRSLRNAPPVEDILAELIQFLSEQHETNLPNSTNGKILLILKYLRSARCLLILDNAESILKAGDRTGRYRDGYEGYGELLRCVAETSHQSCLILTSREKPQGLAKFEGESLPVRSLQLMGLPKAEGQELFHVKGKFTASEAQWLSLIHI